MVGLMVCAHAFAATGDVYPLPWPHKGQVLRYQSCGCADSCWVAEVLDKRKISIKNNSNLRMKSKDSKAIVARLGCDCERLYYDERPAAAVDSPSKDLGSCEPINSSDQKFELIPKLLEQQMKESRQR